MVYIPRLSFKSGINPSLLATFPLTGVFSGTQKLLLTRTRIFGTPISTSNPSGMKPWRQIKQPRFEYLMQHKLEMHNLYHHIPDFKDVHDENWVNVTGRRTYRQQIKLIKDTKKAAKDSKKKK